MDLEASLFQDAPMRPGQANGAGAAGVDFQAEVAGRNGRVFPLMGADHPYRVLVETMSEGAVVLSADGLILYGNRSFCEMVRASSEGVLGTPMQEFIPRVGHDRLYTLLRRGLEGKQRQEFILRALDGATVPVFLSINALRADDWEGLFLVVSDLTAQKENEERLHSLSRKLLDIQETERRHLARELHDQIGQLLSGLKLSLSAIPLLGRKELLATVRRAEREVEDLVGKVQNLSLNLRPGMLDDLGLLPTLLWHFQRYTAATGVKVGFQQSGLDRRFSFGAETAAYRIIQEALTNVARHAVVSQAQVQVHHQRGGLNIVVEDQGRGFVLGPALLSASDGLSGMQERAELLGGQLRIRTAPGLGTSVEANLPTGPPALPL